MINANKRVVILSGSPDSTSSWYLGTGCTWENNYAYKFVENFACEPRQGSGVVNIISHFLTNPVALPGLAKGANSLPQLHRHYNMCRRKGRAPTHYMIDFMRVGNGIHFAKEIYRRIR